MFHVTHAQCVGSSRLKLLRCVGKYTQVHFQHFPNVILLTNLLGQKYPVIVKPAKDLFIDDENRHDGAPVDGYQSMTRNDRC